MNDQARSIEQQIMQKSHIYFFRKNELNSKKSILSTVIVIVIARAVKFDMRCGRMGMGMGMYVIVAMRQARVKESPAAANYK